MADKSKYKKVYNALNDVVDYIDEIKEDLKTIKKESNECFKVNDSGFYNDTLDGIIDDLNDYKSYLKDNIISYCKNEYNSG